ncbi:hypothetical protein [Bradyrhizobium liaoningense]
MFRLDALRKISQASGFIHTLANIIASESVFYSADQIKKRDRFDLISFNEVALLLSLLSESPLSITLPDTYEAELQYKACKTALDALHEEISAYSKGDTFEALFTEGTHFIEPIFYSAGAGFWFDYLALAPQLYQLDRPFLTENGYDIEEFSVLLRDMHTIFRNRFRDFIREQRKNIKKFGLVSSPLSCFIYSPADLPQGRLAKYLKFIDRFSIGFGEGPTVTNPLDYHPCKSRPALRLSETQIFAPLLPMLCEQLYESPFYSIAQDKTYFARNANNRGIASELVLSELLASVAHLELIRDAKLYLRGREIGQIDVAAAFGSTAIIFEVKTKRLTQASKNGDTKNLISDIQAGIIDAQQQLSSIKAALLSRSYDNIAANAGNVDKLASASQVVCVSVMMHEVPAYPLLIRTILEDARVANIVPLTIFDIKIATTYLKNAFDFTYYFATRSILDAHLMYGTESALLGFHLTRRLTIPDRFDQVFIDDSFGQNIDADYPNRDKKLALKFNVKIIDEIIDDIIHAGDPSLFRLFSVLRGMSGSSAKDASAFLKRIEGMLRSDGQPHDATMVFDNVALTFIVANDELSARLRFDNLRRKRDAEGLYAQEYMLILSPRTYDRSKIGRREGSHHFVIRATAMKQNRSGEGEILAFSPRHADDGWELSREKD